MKKCKYEHMMNAIPKPLAINYSLAGLHAVKINQSINNCPT